MIGRILIKVPASNYRNRETVVGFILEDKLAFLNTDTILNGR